MSIRGAFVGDGESSTLSINSIILYNLFGGAAHLLIGQKEGRDIGVKGSKIQIY